jgi:hypothetical protein
MLNTGKEKGNKDLIRHSRSYDTCGEVGASNVIITTT